MKVEYNKGSPFLKYVVSMGIGGSVKSCQDGLEHFYSTFTRLTEGGGTKAIWAIPIWNQHISKRASLTWSRNDDMAIYLCSLDFDVDSPDVA